MLLSSVWLKKQQPSTYITDLCDTFLSFLILTYFANKYTNWNTTGHLQISLKILANSIICNLWCLFFPTPAVPHVQHCEVITKDLTNDVLVFVWMYWSVVYLGRYLSLFRMAGLQAGTLSLSFMPCLLLFASLASLTAPLYWINSGCHFPCWWNNSNTAYNNTGKVG